MNIFCLDVARAAELKGERRSGNETLFECPNHDDHDPSLSVNEKKNCWMCGPCRAQGNAWGLAAFIAGVNADDKVAVKTWLDEHGLLPRGEPHLSRRRTIVATFDYRNEQDQLLFQVVRYQPKAFRQRRPNGNGGWIWDVQGVRKVLYRLPELRAELKGKPVGQRVVYVAEGEKDVETLQGLGLTASTNPGGSGKWTDEHTKQLREAGAERVVIFPDEDEAGEVHARCVAASCIRAGLAVKIVRLPGLPKKGDVSDWKSTGRHRDGLLEIVEATPLLTGDDLKGPGLSADGDIVCMKDIQAQDTEWLWFPYIPLGKVTLLEGDPGVGKSWISLAFCTAVSLGRGLPGKESIQPASTLIFTAEDGLADTIKPRLNSFGADASRIFAFEGPLALNAAGLERIESAVMESRPVLVLIDPLVAYMGAAVDLHRANETRVVMAGLGRLAERRKCAIVCVRHLSKSGKDRAIYRGLGSIDLSAACRSVLLAGSNPDEPSRRALIHIKSNLAPIGQSIGYEIQDGEFRWTGASDLTADRVLEADAGGSSAVDESREFLTALLSQGPVPAAEVLREARKAGIAERTLSRAKRAMRIRSTSWREPGKRGVREWYWALANENLGGQEHPIVNMAM